MYMHPHDVRGPAGRGWYGSRMTRQSPDPTLDRLLRHMAWANARVFEWLRELPDAALSHSAPGSDWNVAAILDHIVGGAAGYVARLEGTPRPPASTPPNAVAQLPVLAATCAGYDARLGNAATVPEGVVTYEREGQTIRRARSTILGQSIHHATEHRAQIAGALAANGLDVIDLDAIDLWAYGDAEGLGA